MQPVRRMADGTGKHTIFFSSHVISRVRRRKKHKTKMQAHSTVLAERIQPRTIGGDGDNDEEENEIKRMEELRWAE